MQPHPRGGRRQSAHRIAPATAAYIKAPALVTGHHAGITRLALIRKVVEVENRPHRQQKTPRIGAASLFGQGARRQQCPDVLKNPIPGAAGLVQLQCLRVEMNDRHAARRRLNDRYTFSPIHRDYLVGWLFGFDVVQEHHLQYLGNRVAGGGPRLYLGAQIRVETGKLRLFESGGG